MIDYLRKFDKSVQILNVQEVETTIIPSYWSSALKMTSAGERKAELLAHWKANFASELSNTIFFLESHLEDVLLIESQGKLSLLYCIKNLTGKIIYYQGCNPLNQNVNEKLLEKISAYDTKLVYFYKKIHNGFFHYSSHAMGLVPCDEIIHFSDYNWGIIDELIEPLRIVQDTTYGFFSSGAGGYVAIDLTSNKATVWFSNDFPNYDVNFWNVVDEWIQIGLED